MTVDLEFLIQKEGDFAWLPLESLTVEILVGRYQIIAQASEADCPIQVHIRHQYVQDGIWQEVVQQQLLRTDSQGRIEVLPSTFLQQGRWIISCATHEEEQHANSEIDRHCVQLQVLEQEIDLDQDWELIDPPLSAHLELNLQGTDLFSPLIAADIASKTAWNNLTPLTPISSSESLPLEDITLEDMSVLEDISSLEVIPSFEETPLNLVLEKERDLTANIPLENIDLKPTEPDLGPADNAEPTLPQLPVLPKDVPPIRLQISPGLILPPALFNSDLEADEIPPPQLPVFPHLDHWEKLSYQELSIALGRLYWSKLDTYGDAIDLDFESLALQERFLQTLSGLALQDFLADNHQSVSAEPTPPSSELDTLEKHTALVPISSEGESYNRTD